MPTAAPQTGCAPGRRFHLIGSIQPVREDSTRSEEIESSRSGVTPHQAQASSRSWPLVTSPVIAGDALPAFLGARPGSHALAREYDTRGNGGGFCSIRSLSSACRRRVAPLMVQIPPSGGGQVTVRGGKAPKSQTTSVKNTENRGLRLRWSAFWAQRCLARCVGRTRTAEYARQPLDTHVNL